MGGFFWGVDFWGGGGRWCRWRGVSGSGSGGSCSWFSGGEVVDDVFEERVGFLGVVNVVDLLFKFCEGDGVGCCFEGRGGWWGWEVFEGVGIGCGFWRVVIGRYGLIWKDWVDGRKVLMNEVEVEWGLMKFEGGGWGWLSWVRLKLKGEKVNVF